MFQQETKLHKIKKMTLQAKIIWKVCVMISNQKEKYDLSPNNSLFLMVLKFESGIINCLNFSGMYYGQIIN